MNLSKKFIKKPYTCQKSAVFREDVKNMKRGGGRVGQKRSFFEILKALNFPIILYEISSQEKF